MHHDNNFGFWARPTLVLDSLSETSDNMIGNTRHLLHGGQTHLEHVLLLHLLEGLFYLKEWNFPICSNVGLHKS